MALTYTDSAALMQDLDFRGRIKVASLIYADSILREPTATAAHNTRLKWAQGVFAQPDTVAMQLHPPVVMDAAVQESGKDITDTALQGSVEAVVNKQF